MEAPDLGGLWLQGPDLRVALVAAVHESGIGPEQQKSMSVFMSASGDERTRGAQLEFLLQMTQSGHQSDEASALALPRRGACVLTLVISRLWSFRRAPFYPLRCVVLNCRRLLPTCRPKSTHFWRLRITRFE